MATIYKWSGTGTVYNTNTTRFREFLSEHTAGTFLEDCRLEYAPRSSTGETFYIRHDTAEVIFCNKYGTGESSSDAGRISFTNGTVSHSIQQTSGSSGQIGRCWITEAILGNTSLIVSCSYNGAASFDTTNNMIGVFMLTKDSNGKLSAVFRNCTVAGTTVTQSTNLVIIAGDSTGKTTINVTPAYNLQKTGLVPIVVDTSSNTTTIPTFYTSFQTEIPSLGFYHGRMNGTDYISNGYCFLRLQD